MDWPSVGEILIISLLITLYPYLIYRIPKKDNKFLRSRWRKKKQLSHSDYESFIFQLAYSLKWMSDNRIGCLIVIEKNDNLQKYVTSGYQVEARLTAEFLITVFSNKNSALHDGGVVIREFNIVSVSSYFPITQSKMTTEFGSRHRASAGLTEITDAISLIVSETSGRISYSQKGKIEALNSDDMDSLADQLFTLFNFYIN